MKPEQLDTVVKEVSRASGVAIACTGSMTHGALEAARFSLANGLRVLLLVDRRAELFAFQTWFRVGSKHEDADLTGMAHLFEHLMFKGTTQHAAGVFDREMERRGSDTNAATWVDWTFYLEGEHSAKVEYHKPVILNDVTFYLQRVTAFGELNFEHLRVLTDKPDDQRFLPLLQPRVSSPFPAR